MALFNFTLLPLEQIAPWGPPEKPSLSWFGLSLGYFWLELGGQQVLRSAESDATGEPPFCNYQLARYWEDLLHMLPEVLEPVPADILAMRGAPDWEQRFAQAERALDAGYTYSPEWLRIEKAVMGDALRSLDLAHLVAPPRVDLWRVDDQLQITWSSRPEGAELWAPVHGTSSMSVQSFVDEVKDFDARLLSAMGARVQSVLAAGGIPGVEVDLEHLQREQADRSTWLSSALARSAQQQVPGEGSDWEWLRRQLASAGP
jgi:hypothetical protein